MDLTPENDFCLIITIVTSMCFATLLVLWFRRCSYFPIKERSPQITVFSNTIQFAFLLYQFYVREFECPVVNKTTLKDDPTVTTAEAYTTFIMYLGRKLIVWSHMLRMYRLSYAYQTRYACKQNTQSRRMSITSQIIRNIVRDEWKCLLLVITVAGGATALEWMLYLQCSKTPFDTTPSISSQSFSTVEILIMICLTYSLRSTHQDHRLRLELVTTTLVLHLISITATSSFNAADDKASTGFKWICSYRESFHIFQVAKFFALLAVTMVLPLLHSSKAYIFPSSEVILDKYKVFGNDYDAAKLFRIYLHRMKSKVQVDLLLFIQDYNRIRSTEEQGCTETLLNLYKDYFVREASIFPKGVENRVREARYLADNFNFSTFTESHDYAVKTLECIYFREYRHTKVAHSLEKVIAENTKFSENLEDLNMLPRRI